MKRHHVRVWSDRVDARYGLAELVKRLVEETSEGSVEAEFAFDEGVDIGGFDGTVSAVAGSRWVPSGLSAWELSTRRDVGTKANADYRKRKAAPKGWSASETAYVAVSLRVWQNREDWAAKRTTEGRWRRVQALGLDDIMSWLSEAPRSEFWLAERLGLHPHEFENGPGWWKQCRRGTEWLFDSAVALAGRNSAADELRQRIATDRGPIVVEAPTVEEALEFIAAVGEVSDCPAGSGSLLDCMVFVRGPNAWRRLSDEENPQIVLVATDPELGDHRGSANHPMILPVQAHGGAMIRRRERDGTSDCIVVPRLDSRSVAEALNNENALQRGVDFHRAQELGVLGRRSASALRRQLSTDPAIRSPQWAQTDFDGTLTTKRAMTAALLVGEWEAGSPQHVLTSADRQVLVRLAGGSLDYESIEIELKAVAIGADPMLAVSGSRWRLVNPQEAWLLLAGRLMTDDALGRFLSTVTDVLGERNPLGSLDGDEHAEAQLRGVRRAYSRDLRRGMARTLALLCAYGTDLPLRGAYDAAALAGRCVGQMFNPVSEDGASLSARVRRMEDLGDVLPLLAEAEPAGFVSAVDQTLQFSSEASGLWFTDAWDDLSILGRLSPHTQLLFAVETLAWLPGYLPDVADILFRLEVLDPGGGLANRPAGSFSAIFSAWAPQTCIGHQERLEVLRGLRDRLVESAASGSHCSALVRLLATLIPSNDSVVMSSSRPQIRDYKPSRESMSRDVECAYVAEVNELLVSLIEYRVSDRKEAVGMLDVLGGTSVTMLSPRHRERLWTLFEEAVSVFPVEELSEMHQRLAALARHHRDYADAAWALPAEETARIAGMVEQIAGGRVTPDDPVEARLWLFDEWFPDLGQEISITNNRTAYEKMLREKRVFAVGEVMRTVGLCGLFRLAARAEANPRAAPVEILGARLEEWESQLPNVDNPEGTLLSHNIETPLFAILNLPVDDTAIPPDAHRDARIATGYFAARFRRIRLATGDGWSWLDELLVREGVTASQQARLVECTRDYPRAWQKAKGLGPEPLTAYWKLMNWASVGDNSEHLEDVARGLLSVGRAAEVIKLLNKHNIDATLDPDLRFDLAVQALEALARNGETHATEAIDHWGIIQLLDFLAEQCPLTEYNLNEPLLQRLTEIELAYVNIRDTREPAPFIHNRMALDPRSFVNLVSIAYPSAGDQTQDLGTYADMTPDQRTDWRQQRNAALRILHSWQRPPGLDAAGAVDYQRLRAWISDAQRQLDQENRREHGDRHIGRVLSAIPAETSDGIAPPIAIRQLLEDRQTPEFEDGLAQGLRLGPTGIGGGLLTEVVTKSNQAHEQATRVANTIAARWPRTARLLRRVAQDHTQETRIWQQVLDKAD